MGQALAWGGQGVGEVGLGPGFDVGDFGHGEAGDDFGGGWFFQQSGAREQQVREAAFGVLLFELLVEREARFQDLGAERQAFVGVAIATRIRGARSSSR